MVMSLLLAAARKRLASAIEQCSNIVDLRPGGRLAKPGANSGSILNLANSPSSNATALITMFNTYPLMVRRSSFELSRILSASFLEQLMRIAVRRPIADLLSNFFDISNAVNGVFFLRVHLAFLANEERLERATSHKQPPLIESCLGPLALTPI
jgi:hypothetical protein